jgi:ADP-L-glycero-D-manno-heptose 6-epimerase
VRASAVQAVTKSLDASVVVTGANGFIGTHIVEALLRLSLADLHSPGAKPRTARLRFSNFQEARLPEDLDVPLCVVGADLAASAGRANAARFAGSAKYRYLAHDALLAELESGRLQPKAIIHNGACSSTVETDWRVFAELNVEYTQRLWQVAARLGIVFLYASSAAVYGDGTSGFCDANEKCAEFTPLNLYGQSKHDFDLWALGQSESPPAWFGLRYFNVYGAFEAHKEAQASMVFHGYKQATRAGSIKLFQSVTPEYGHGEQKRDFIFVDDITKYTLMLLSHGLRTLAEGKTLGQFVNLGTGTARTWNDLAKHVFLALSLPERIDYVPMPENIARHYQNYTAAEHVGLQRLGLPVQFTDLAFGVRSYVQRYLMRGL